MINLNDDNLIFKLSFSFRRRLRYNRLVAHFESTKIHYEIVTISFENHPFYRLFSNENFQKFIRSVELTIQNKHQSYNFTIQKNKNSFERITFYHIQCETIVYLLNRLITVVDITMEQLLSKERKLSLNQLLTVNGFARIIQIDLESNSLNLQIPLALCEKLKNNQLVLIVNETVVDIDD